MNIEITQVSKLAAITIIFKVGYRKNIYQMWLTILNPVEYHRLAFLTVCITDFHTSYCPNNILTYDFNHYVFEHKVRRLKNISLCFSCFLTQTSEIVSKKVIDSPPEKQLL